ncbi:MAG: TonB-dependent receptor plug domain-containing protein, partial [Bacteroidota bacterium]
MKIINVRIGRYVPVLIFLSLAFISNAQNSGQIILLDKDTKSPIIGAAYQYGKQMGSSDANGIITIDFLESQTLLISHISYGRWKLSPNEVTQALKDGQYLIEEKVMLVQPVTILGVRTSKQDPESINIKNQDRLAHDAGDILKQTPLVSGIRKSGSYGFDPVMRGFKYDQINIVIDGAQSATAACPNRMDPPTSQIAPNMISEVEVLKGPHSLRYGTTFGGVINFVTSKPSFTNNSEFYGRVTGAYESNGNIGRTEGLIGFKATKYDIGVFGSYSTGSDYTDGNGEKVLANFSRSSLGTIIGFNINENQSITLSATHNLAHDVDFPALPMDLTSDDTWMFNAKHNLQLNKEYLKTWNTTVFASFVDHKMNNLLKNLDPRMLNASTDAQTK